jgi:hypothetical protein
MTKRTKTGALALATAILSHPAVQEQVKKLAEAGFEKARQWWANRGSKKRAKVATRPRARKSSSTVISAKKTRRTRKRKKS